MSPAPQDPPPHILVINSDPTVVELFREILEGEGYRVTTLLEAPGDVAAVAALQPDAVVVDAVPEADAGEVVLAQLQADFVVRPWPVLVLSTNPELLEQIAAQPERYGHPRLLAKPFAIEAFVGTIQGMLAGA